MDIWKICYIGNHQNSLKRAKNKYLEKLIKACWISWDKKKQYIHQSWKIFKFKIWILIAIFKEINIWGRKRKLLLSLTLIKKLLEIKLSINPAVFSILSQKNTIIIGDLIGIMLESSIYPHLEQRTTPMMSNN